MYRKPKRSSWRAYQKKFVKKTINENKRWECFDFPFWEEEVAKWWSSFLVTLSASWLVIVKDWLKLQLTTFKYLFLRVLFLEWTPPLAALEYRHITVLYFLFYCITLYFRKWLINILRQTLWPHMPVIKRNELQNFIFL